MAYKTFKGIRKGAVFTVEETDGYHSYPKGTYVALCDIPADEVLYLFKKYAQDDCCDDDLVDSMMRAGLIADHPLHTIYIKSAYSDERVTIVGNWKATEED